MPGRTTLKYRQGSVASGMQTPSVVVAAVDPVDSRWRHTADSRSLVSVGTLARLAMARSPVHKSTAEVGSLPGRTSGPARALASPAIAHEKERPFACYCGEVHATPQYTKGPAVNVAQEVLEHKTLMIALVACAAEVARELGLEAEMPVAAMAHALGANRTSVYEQRDRLLPALRELAGSRPGRPPARDGGANHCPRDEQALTVRVLEFRLRHLDAVDEHAGRTTYSPSFRRFILGEHDAWQGSTDRFARACRVPSDTLKDWLRDDCAGVVRPAPAKGPLEVPRDASDLTRSIACDFEKWEGSTRHFVRLTAERYGLVSGQVFRVLRICGAIRGRRRRAFRHRGTTERRSPGAMLVTDGKTLDVLLTGSGCRTQRNWQGIVDQATGCDTAVVVTEQEDADSARRAFEASVAFLGDVAPAGLLIDNKPCYEEWGLRQHVEGRGTVLVRATLGRAENKAGLEGAFSLFERRVGTIRLDDSSVEALIGSAVGEVVRAYTGATNGVPRQGLQGLSREAALREARPSREQQEADREFARRLAARHDRERHSDWRDHVKPESRRLLARVFTRLGLAPNDPCGKLQEYLSIYQPAAIRLGAIIVAARLKSRHLERRHAHRYLTKVIQSQQEMLDLERQGEELLTLSRLQAQDWVSVEGAEYEDLVQNKDRRKLACAVAARAALGGLPVRAAFWTEKLLALLEGNDDLFDVVRHALVRRYDAPAERRLLLLDRIAALECGIR